MPSQDIRVALTFLTFHMFQMLPLPLPLGTELMVWPGLPVAISGVGVGIFWIFFSLPINNSLILFT